MRFSDIQLSGYASFSSTDVLALGPGINFFVGQNNTGKSALLRSFRPSFQQSPHRNATTFRREQLTASVQQAKVQLSGAELFRTWQLAGWELIWTVEAEPKSFSGALDNFFNGEKWLAECRRDAAGLTVVNMPAHTGQHVTTVRFRPSPLGAEFVGYEARGVTLNHIVDARWHSAVFYFDAQRYNVGRCAINLAEKLQPDAGNLPAVLMRMQGNRGDLFNALKQHMRDIFPTVRNLSISSQSESMELEILVWPVLKQQYRELATPLDESGTGLSQVLAILTVAMTMEDAVIVIDEISSFLHPAAAKALVRILESHYGHHQYIISTHSPEVLSACRPSAVHLVTKTDFTSTVVPIDVENVSQLRALTSELGLSMTDVFASDRVIWVEGPTEELAFPYIFEETRDDSASERQQRAPQFTAVVATGDFTAKRTRPELVFDIYDRLSNAASVLSGAVTFAFDAEGLTEKQREDLTRQAKGRLLFLPRRLFECYLLHPAAITSVINTWLEEEPVSVDAVEGFLSGEGGSAKYKAANEWNGDWKNEKWLDKVDAANLLSDLFNSLSGARLPFSKRVHSFAILKEILASDRAHVEDLTHFVKQLVALSRS
ncbi:AAA family ATPase [Rhizobium sp. LARHSG275]|uniref:AAA family ATPase n=1 Tax=Rhizobium TaxID=379 RepID=UPI00138997F0|nr:AAA family ATPase [Rhizobium laguerreae]NDK47888.1 AAA family ATPase [Rhizobium laguerreae]